VEQIGLQEPPTPQVSLTGVAGVVPAVNLDSSISGVGLGRVKI